MGTPALLYEPFPGHVGHLPYSANSSEEVALCFCNVAQAFISETFDGHGNIVSGVNAQANPYSLLCELGREGAPALAALLNWADLAGAYFSNSENQNLHPRGQAGKDRITLSNDRLLRAI